MTAPLRAPVGGQGVVIRCTKLEAEMLAAAAMSQVSDFRKAEKTWKRRKEPAAAAMCAERADRYGALAEMLLAALASQEAAHD